MMSVVHQGAKGIDVTAETAGSWVNKLLVLTLLVCHCDREIVRRHRCTAARLFCESNSAGQADITSTK